MQFAVVGDSDSVFSFAQAIAANSRHELVALAGAPGLSARLLSLVPGLRLYRHWEELLGDQPIDAIVVADDDDDTLQGARQLAQSGKALIIAPVAGQGATFAYELTLLQDEQPLALVPLLGLRGHPLVARLGELLAQGHAGPVQHVQLERKLDPARSGAGPSIMSSDEVAAAFLVDIDLARSLWGDFDQVTAIRSGDAASGYSLATVTLGGPSVPQLVWSVAAAACPAWCLRVVSQQGTITLAGDPAQGTLRLESTRPGSESTHEEATFDAAEWLLDKLPEVIAASRKSATAANRSSAISRPSAGWDDFTRGVELLDAVDRSVKRRRTIEIHFETPSELGQFKTHMTAAGCSLLMLTLLATVAYLTTATLLDLNERFKQVLVFLIFAPLGLFLALQALVFIARPAPKTDENR